MKAMWIYLFLGLVPAVAPFATETETETAVDAETEAETWSGTLPAHGIVCSAPIPTEDEEAAVEAVGTWIESWPEDREEDRGALFSDPLAPTHLRFCAVYLGGDVPPPAGTAVEPVEAGPAVFTFCASDEDASACRARLQEALGAERQGRTWSRPIFEWVEVGEDPTSAEHPERWKLEYLAVSPEELKTSPGKDFELVQVGSVWVGFSPAVDRGQDEEDSAAPEP